MSYFKPKILLAGPSGAGKTYLANLLAEASDSNSAGQTRGARILEFEWQGTSEDGKTFNADVELWDCSGDKKYENCWPALWHSVNGVILVYRSQEQEKALEQWYRLFVQQQHLKDSQCIILANHSGDAPSSTKLSGVHCVSVEGDPQETRIAFGSFLSSLYSNWQNSAINEEEGIIIA